MKKYVIIALLIVAALYLFLGKAELEIDQHQIEQENMIVDESEANGGAPVEEDQINIEAEEIGDMNLDEQSLEDINSDAIPEDEYSYNGDVENVQ